jgi:asparagine synthase (glutamine-hydrolysing)
MCGIAGFFGPPDDVLLRSMTAALAHRGPDDSGFLETDEASLGFRRLSIIDLEHGNQPVSTEDGLVHLIYNGEVYNFRELRAELESLGHRFCSAGDAEVVLHAYAEWGPRCFTRFNGMGAVALLEERGPVSRLVVGRVHFGIKPLFYARSGNRILFASEIKAILEDRTFPRRVNEQLMYEYLAYGLFDHTDSTLFDGVLTVPAAAYATIDATGVCVERYWEPVLGEDGSPDPAVFRAAFERAVARRLVADVPVGVCLSGGLDSSSICAVLGAGLEGHVADSASLGDRLKTFSVVFPGDPIDESGYIDTVVEATHAESSRAEPTSADLVRDLEPWIWHVEEPMVSSAPFAMWTVMGLARQQVTVVFDGQGGDELLAGYDHYPYVYLRELLRKRRFVSFLREAVRWRDVLLPLIGRRLRHRVRGVEVNELLEPGFTDGRPKPLDDRVQDDLKLRLLQDFTTYSLPPLLRYEDRTSMAHSLETRSPFLDQELVELILRLPASAIIDQGWNRRILREGLRDVLPDTVYRRRKKIGFTTPEFRWFRQERTALEALLRSPTFTARKYWRGPAVAEAFGRACDGEREESMFFWRVINAEIWLRLFFDADRVVDQPRSELPAEASRGCPPSARGPSRCRRARRSAGPAASAGARRSTC